MRFIACLVLALVLSALKPNLAQAGLVRMQELAGVVVGLDTSAATVTFQTRYQFNDAWHDTTVQVVVPRLIFPLLVGDDSARFEFNAGWNFNAPPRFEFLSLVVPISGTVEAQGEAYSTIRTETLGDLAVRVECQKFMLGQKVTLSRVAIMLDRQAQTPKLWGISRDTVEINTTH